MPRLFSGLELPHAVRLRLSMIRGQIPGAGWVDADDLHMTLRFVGDVDDDQAHEFADCLAEIEQDAFDIRISGTGAFGGAKPHAVYAAVEPCPELTMLQRAHDRAARAAGLAPAPHPFQPHVTLARMRHGRADAVARFLEETGDLRIEPFRVERFVLFSARPGTGGGPYAVEEAYALA